jgi:hypothetical protein
VRGGRLENADLVPERRNIRPSRGAPIVHRPLDLQFEPGIGLTERPAVVPGVSDQQFTRDRFLQNVVRSSKCSPVQTHVPGDRPVREERMWLFGTMELLSNTLKKP